MIVWSEWSSSLYRSEVKVLAVYQFFHKRGYKIYHYRYAPVMCGLGTFTEIGYGELLQNGQVEAVFVPKDFDLEKMEFYG